MSFHCISQSVRIQLQVIETLWLVLTEVPLRQKIMFLQNLLLVLEEQTLA